MPQRASPGQGPTNAYFYLDGQQVGETTNNGSDQPDFAASIAQRLTQPSSTSLWANSSSTSSGGAQLSSDFDSNYQALNTTDPASTVATYTVLAGDTLASIAQKLWGDSSLWYLLADANGLGFSQTLAAGQVLTIPDKVTNFHESSSTAEVYDPSKAVGDVMPTQLPPAPPQQPSHGGGCGVIGEVITAIAALVVQFIPGVNAIADSIIEPILDPVLVATPLSDAAIVGVDMAVDTGVVAAAGDAIGQGVAIAVGAQQGFNWSQVALAGISAGVGSELPNVPDVSQLENSFGSPIAAYGVNGALNSAITQGIGVATGLQNNFSWTSVAVSAIQAGAGYAAGHALNGSFGTSAYNPQAPANFGTNLASGVGGALAGAATRSALTGSNFGQNILTDLPTAIGNTIGNLVLGEASRPQVQLASPQPIQLISDQAVQLEPAPVLAAVSTAALEVTAGIMIDQESGQEVEPFPSPQTFAPSASEVAEPAAAVISADGSGSWRNGPGGWGYYMYPGADEPRHLSSIPAAQPAEAASTADTSASAVTPMISVGAPEQIALAPADYTLLTPFESDMVALTTNLPNVSEADGPGQITPMSTWSVWTEGINYRYGQAEQTTQAGQAVLDRRSITNSAPQNALLSIEGFGLQFLGQMQGGVGALTGSLDTLVSLVRGEGPWASPAVRETNDQVLTTAGIAGAVFDPALGAAAESAAPLDVKVALQGVTNRAVAELNANPGLARDLMSPGSYQQLVEGTNLAPASYGKAVERLTAQMVANDSELSQVLTYQSRPFVSTPDFFGYEGYNLRPLDITTENMIPLHELRPYGPATQYVTHPGLPADLVFPQ